jgi:hypothetical protein
MTQASLPLGTALLTDAALSLLLWNLAFRLALLISRVWPGLLGAFA